MDEDERKNFTMKKMSFFNVPKLLEVFIDITFMEQLNNLFLFKNLEGYIYDFFSCLF